MPSYKNTRGTEMITLSKHLLRSLIQEEVSKYLHEAPTESPTPDVQTSDVQTSDDEPSSSASAGLSKDVEQMSTAKAQELASEVFVNINAGRIANAKSVMASLSKNAAGRIALAVQALRWYGNASAEEINTHAAIIRKIASSVDEPPQ